MSKLVFIGLGAMGEPMAANLLKHGYEVIVTGRRSAAAVERLQGKGARRVETLAEAGAATVFLMLPSSAEVEAVILGEQGLIETLEPGAVIVDCSTSDPASTRQLAAKLLQREIRLVDAPVTRGVKGARDGTLAFFIGGGDAEVQQVLPYLQAMGTDHFRFGAVGSGHTAKIINNMISLSTLSLLSEATYLARDAGLDIDTFYQAVMAGNGKSGTLESFGPRLSKRNYGSINFRIDLAAKDLALSQQLAARAGQPFFVSQAAYTMFQVAEKLGLAKKDIANIAEFWTSRD